jgi:UDP-2,4-diacetamido-2,4,6-trideoxy-beta-L-altropyranose hydrolase
LTRWSNIPSGWESIDISGKKRFEAAEQEQSVTESHGTLLIRADAGIRMGTGHVMRCMGLAQAWQDLGGRVVYAMAATSPGLDERLRSESIEVRMLAAEPGSEEDARMTAEAAGICGRGWIVLDGYHFDAPYQRILKQSGLRLLAVDDLGALPNYCADIVLNQDPIAGERLYRKREPYTRLLLGTEYAFLRREFRQRSRVRREIPLVARKLLVTFGGSDPDNVTETVIRSLDAVSVDNLEVVVLVGPSNPHGTRLELAASACHAKVRLLHNPANLPELMAECEMAVTAGGTTTVWELAYFSVPSLVVPVVDNQEPAIGYLHDRGACLRLGNGSQLSAEELAGSISRLCGDRNARAALGAALGAIIDGRGPDRVCAAMLSGIAETMLEQSAEAGRSGAHCESSTVGA